MSRVTLRSYPSDINKLSIREAINKYGVETVRRYINREAVCPKHIRKQFKSL